MAEAIIKYSELIADDGGFAKTQDDLKKLGVALIAEAKRIKKEIGIIDPKNIQLLSEYAEAVEVLKRTNETHKKTLKVVHRAQEEHNKEQKEAIKITDQQNKSLADLELEYKKLQKELKDSKKLEKDNAITTKEAAEQQAKLQVELKNVRSERTKNQKEILDSNKLTKKQEKLQKAMTTLQKERAETLDEVRERMSALRLVVQNTNLETVEGKKKIAAYNQEINELTDVLSENSDNFVQNKINVGNYSESIKSALEETGAFETGIGALDMVLNKMADSLLNLTNAQEDSTDATKEQTDEQDNNTSATQKQTKAKKALRKAMLLLNKSFRTFSKVAAASGILAIAAAIGAIFAMFRQGRSGVVKTQKAMAIFKNTLTVIINFLSDAISAIGSLFSAIFNGIQNLALKIERTGLKINKTLLEAIPGEFVGSQIEKIQQRIKDINKELSKNPSDIAGAWDEVKKVFGELDERIEDGTKSIKQNFEAIYKSFELGDKIRKATLELIKLKSELRTLQFQSDDDTLSLRTKLEASRLALQKNLEVLEKESEIRKMNLALANAKAKADLQANQTSIPDEFDARVNELLEKTGKEFAKGLLELNIDIKERTQTNPLDDMLLEGTQTALQAYKEAELEKVHAREETAKKIREINRDIFEQNLDLFIDLIDKQKDLSEQYVTDITKNFKSRVKEFERFLLKFRENAQKELNEFNKLAKKNAKTIARSIQNIEAKPKLTDFDKKEIVRLKERLAKLSTLNFRIVYDDDGDMHVFNGQTELAIDNIVKLNEQLQKTGLTEVTINRFREMMVETQAARKDFREIDKTLTTSALKIKEMKGLQIIEKEELEKIRNLNKELERLSAVNVDLLSDEERQAYLDQIEAIEEEKTRISQEAEKKRVTNRIASIDREMARVEKGSERYIELMNERIALQKELANLEYGLNTESLTDGLDKAKDKWKQFADDLRTILTEVFKGVEDAQQKALDRTEKNLDKQQDAVQAQRERAKEGLSNTLAFEQKQLAEREKRMLEEQKKLEQIQKLKAYWNTYNANLQSLGPNEDSGDAIIKTLRDMAILEGITAGLASFGEGGIIADELPKNGIFRGQSHKGNNKGIPIMVEGNEGIFSVNEMNNLGRGNFYALKEMAGRGKLDHNFFGDQHQDFLQAVPVGSDNRNMEAKLERLIDTVRSKESQSINTTELVGGFMRLTETVKTKNKTIRNHYKIKKPRL